MMSSFIKFYHSLAASSLHNRLSPSPRLASTHMALRECWWISLLAMKKTPIQRVLHKFYYRLDFHCTNISSDFIYEFLADFRVIYRQKRIDCSCKCAKQPSWLSSRGLSPAVVEYRSEKWKFQFTTTKKPKKFKRKSRLRSFKLLELTRMDVHCNYYAGNEWASSQVTDAVEGRSVSRVKQAKKNYSE